MKSFDSNDKSFEERFDPKFRTIGDSQLQNHDQKKGQTPTSKYFRLEFSKSIPLETKTFFALTPLKGEQVVDCIYLG